MRWGPLEQRPCKHCGRLFDPQHTTHRVCARTCPAVMHFAGQPRPPLSAPDRNALVLQWTGLAWKIAVKYGTIQGVGRRTELADLYQEAVIGLVVAAEKYDADHASGAGFPTYAYFWVAQYVRRYIRGANVVHVPESAQQKVKADPQDERWQELVRKAKAALRVGGFPEDEKEEVCEPGTYEELPDYYERDRLRKAVGRLDARRQAVLEARFGTEEGLREAGARLGIGGERVRQLETDAILKLRRWLAEEPLPVCRGGKCRRPPALDGYCPAHHPVARLAALQARLERLFEWCEAEDSPEAWARYGKLERREQALLRQVDELNRPAEARRCS